MKSLLLCALFATASAQVVKDGGGRDVTVALFSERAAHSVTLAPVGDRAWTATCATCAHTPLTSTLSVSSRELFAGGAIRVTDATMHETRTATGLWHLRPAPHGDLDVLLTLSSERYVAAVLQAEASPSEPTESLQALAIRARTYALNGTHFHAQPGHLMAELCDSTQCQALSSAPISAGVQQAVRATAGETLWFHGHRAEVFFSQSCGGITESAGDVWPTLRSATYLQSHADPYCLRKDPAAWHAEIPLAKLTQLARSEGWQFPAEIVSAHIAARSASHRALRITFAGDSGASATIAASALRFGIGRALGWNLVRSDAYELAVRNKALVFDGHGHGHGVGLCQTGAREMAVEGKSGKEILGFYFPGATVGITPADTGWREVQSGTLRMRSAEVLTAAEQAHLAALWSDAQRRFAPTHALTPQIVFAPTTEVFRQLTTLPGWMLAGTSGDTVVLQPRAILQAHNPDGTLLHEMLHVLVEAQATPRAQLWLREGLVEVLAGEPAHASGALPAASLESALLHPESQAENERAHNAAAAKVQALVTRYGIVTVKGWLTTGVPASIA